MLMLGTVWVWLYQNLDSLIEKRLQESIKALETFQKELEVFLETRAEQLASYAPPQDNEQDNTGCLVVPGKILKEMLFSIPVAIFKMIRQVTQAVLVGRVAKGLFVLGLFMWNASKALSYYTLP